MKHAVETVQRLVSENRGDRRSVLQIGYNLGRLSELTGLGREPFWDRWKDAVANWDEPALRALAESLPDLLQGRAPGAMPAPGDSSPAREEPPAHAKVSDVKTYPDTGTP